MDLAALVSQGFASIPDGIAGTFSVSRTVPGVADFAADTRTGDTTETWSNVRGVIFPIDPDKAATLSLKVERSRKLLLPAYGAPFTPVAGCVVTDVYGIEWRVVGPVELGPTGGAAALYTIMVTR